jgi:outer membrane lipoprotein SlyB
MLRDVNGDANGEIGAVSGAKLVGIPYGPIGGGGALNWGAKLHCGTPNCDAKN